MRADFDPEAYKILLEILVQGDYTEVSEIAYRFEQREAGVSKLGINNVVNHLRHLSSLFLRSRELYLFEVLCVSSVVFPRGVHAVAVLWK